MNLVMMSTIYSAILYDLLDEACHEIDAHRIVKAV